MNANTIIKDQSGTALVIALIMIVVLTLIGLASTFSSTFEISLSGNKRLSTDAFYNAETRMYTTVPRATAIDDQQRDLVGNNTDDTKLPADLQGQSVNRQTVIDPSQLSSRLPLPSGKTLSDNTKVTLYHQNATPGQGHGAVKPTYYIIDAEGTDQIVSSDQYKSTVHLRMKVLINRPTDEESQ